MGIYAPTTQGFQSLLRISRSSIATPPWFASPVDAEEDEQTITVVFHVPESCGTVQVRANDQSIMLCVASGAIRLCALPCAIVVNGLETERLGDLLRVRVPKKRPATDSTGVATTT